MSFHVPIAIKPLPDYRLWLRFPDGVEGIADLSSMAGVGVFQRWQDNPATFQNVKIAEDSSLLWDDDLDLCSDALYLEVSGKIPKEVFPGLEGLAEIEGRDIFVCPHSDAESFGDITDQDFAATGRRAFRRLEQQEETVPACYVGGDFTDEDLSLIAAHTLAEIERQDEEWARKQALSKAHLPN